MLFSLLIANYNNGKFFKDCYDSIIAQTFGNWEAIIVDDGSADDSVIAIKNIIGNDTRFQLFLNEANKGCGYTKRKCAELASGDICAFLDPDDSLLPDALEKMHTGYLNNPQAVLIHSSLIYCNENLKKQDVYPHASAIKKPGAWFLNLDHSVTAFASFKRSHYLKTEGIDAYLQGAVDQDLYLKMYETGPFQFINEPLYLYRRHHQSISANSNLEKGRFWQWFVIMQAAKRRSIIVDELFSQFFINRRKYEKLERKMNKNIILKLYNSLSSLFETFNVKKEPDKEIANDPGVTNKIEKHSPLTNHYSQNK
jgi:glycosyltransferase involved in cell wall biosynthesis